MHPTALPAPPHVNTIADCEPPPRLPASLAPPPPPRARSPTHLQFRTNTGGGGNCKWAYLYDAETLSGVDLPSISDGSTGTVRVTGSPVSGVPAKSLEQTANWSSSGYLLVPGGSMANAFVEGGDPVRQVALCVCVCLGAIEPPPAPGGPG